MENEPVRLKWRVSISNKHVDLRGHIITNGYDELNRYAKLIEPMDLIMIVSPLPEVLNHDDS